jgi:hypothetical protein
VFSYQPTIHCVGLDYSALHRLLHSSFEPTHSKMLPIINVWKYLSSVSDIITQRHCECADVKCAWFSSNCCCKRIDNHLYTLLLVWGSIKYLKETQITVKVIPTWWIGNQLRSEPSEKKIINQKIHSDWLIGWEEAVDTFYNVNVLCCGTYFIINSGWYEVFILSIKIVLCLWIDIRLHIRYLKCYVFRKDNFMKYIWIFSV